MRFSCEIEKITTLKKGAKLILSIPDEHTINVLKDIYNFIDKPLDVELLINENKQKEKLSQITEDQRKKIFATLRDISIYTGDSLENIKENLKILFTQNSRWDDFSLSNCSSELASEFLDFLINFSFENGVPMSEHPINRVDNLDSYLLACLKHRICCVCGALNSEVHHWDAIGMGRDRTHYDDSNHRKICLCRKHHDEAHNIGRDSFKAKYHVYGVLV